MNVRNRFKTLLEKTKLTKNDPEIKSEVPPPVYNNTMPSQQDDKSEQDVNTKPSESSQNQHLLRPSVKQNLEHQDTLIFQSKPKSIGRYKILEEIGRGAMAYVYKAYDPEIDRFLAVKVLREDLATNDDYRKGFIREAKFAGQLAHPNIVTVYDVGVADDKPYIAMELLDGVPLDELLKKRLRLPLKYVLGIVIQLSRALYYAHKQGVIHRDIKPGNIICLTDHKTFKLTDFGIAQLDESISTEDGYSDKVLGTPEYMPPEQILGHQIDARSDLYSLGVLIYTLLSGKTPFVADDYGELFKKIVKDKAPSLEVDNVTFHDEIKDIVRKLLQKQPEKRYQNAAQLMLDLKELIQIMEMEKKQKTTNNFTSLKLRWTLGMAGLVMSTMFIGLVVVYFQQFQSMRDMVIDNNRSFAKMIAFEIAEPLLTEDMVALNAIVADLKKNQELEYISIRNLKGIILASTVEQEKNKTFILNTNAEFMHESDGSSVYERKVNEEHRVFDIDSDIKYQDAYLGRVYLTFSADKLINTTRVTLFIMVALMLVTLVAVFSLSWIFAHKVSSQIRKVIQALERVRRGQLGRRLSIEKNDEFGRLNEAFNNMSESLELRFENKEQYLSEEMSHLNVSQVSASDNSLPVDEQETMVIHQEK